MTDNFGENDVDTVSPLDGDGHNVLGLEDQFKEPNVKQEDYETRGQTTVATRRGYRFVPSDHDFPVVNSLGYKVTADEAAALVEESGGVVFVVNNDKKED